MPHRARAQDTFCIILFPLRVGKCALPVDCCSAPGMHRHIIRTYISHGTLPDTWYAAVHAEEMRFVSVRSHRRQSAVRLTELPGRLPGRSVGCTSSVREV